MTSNRRITILYVDDEESNLFLFKITFQQKYAVFTASSPVQGLEELDAHHDEIIVVVSDMRMPKMNGVEFIRKAREKYQNIAYFILSGFDFNEEIEEALENHEIQRFFRKPLITEELEEAISGAIDDLI